ncbi:MAG: amidohydrolase family protein [Pirellulales bacterium]|nr:amidohydrolase family protein [Pirellulales bacterium]
MTVISGRLALPDGIVAGSLEMGAGRIAQIALGRSAPAENVFDECLIVPGFIDTHTHGLGRHDVFETDDLVGMARMQVRFGTTGFLPTAASLSAERYLAFGRHVLAAQREAGPDAAEIIGAHFEGPFVNPSAKGGMDEAFLRGVDLEECRRYLDEVPGAMKLMTVAPELPGALELIGLLRRRGVVALIGHSRANREELDRAIRAGLTMVCHLFNTFEREGDDPDWPWKRGLLDAVLEDRRLTAEVNGDMIHVRPEHVRLAIERFAPDRFVAITDSVPGAGLEPGEYRMIDGRPFSNRSGAARLVSNGTLIGSIVTMDQVFGNLVEQCGVDPADAARFTSANAARALGIDAEVGSLEVGKAANLAVLDEKYRCVATFVRGRRVYAR